MTTRITTNELLHATENAVGALTMLAEEGNRTSRQKCAILTIARNLNSEVLKAVETEQEVFRQIGEEIGKLRTEVTNLKNTMETLSW